MIVKVKEVRNLKYLNKHLNGYSFDDRYVANNKGEVFLINSIEKDTYNVTKMKPFITKDGYVEYVLTMPSGKENIKKHVQGQIISCWLFNKPIAGKKEVNHKDGNRENNYYLNLEFNTHQENIKHSFEKLGKKVWNSKK